MEGMLTWKNWVSKRNKIICVIEEKGGGGVEGKGGINSIRGLKDSWQIG